MSKITRDSTEWAGSVFKAWPQYRNNEILTLDAEYPNVSVYLETTSPRAINYSLTRLILEVMKKDGTAYPAISLYLFACGLVRHFRDYSKRFDLNILLKGDPNFDSFRKALDSRRKEMTAPDIGTKKQPADPLFSDNDVKLRSTGTVGLRLALSDVFNAGKFNSD